MHPIQRSLLRAKHWELFSLWLIMGVLASMAADVVKGHPPLGGFSFTLDFFLGAIGKLDFAVIFTWSYVAGSFLNSISPKHLRLHPGIFLLASAVCLMLGLLPKHWAGDMLWEVLLSRSLALICFAYMIRFPSKTLMVAEYQEPSRFPDYFGYFIAVFFFPVGVWFLQPHINELFEAYQDAPTPSAPAQPAANFPT